jgi:hypothetical protein
VALCGSIVGGEAKRTLAVRSKKRMGRLYATRTIWDVCGLKTVSPPSIQVGLRSELSASETHGRQRGENNQDQRAKVATRNDCGAFTVVCKFLQAGATGTYIVPRV